MSTAQFYDRNKVDAMLSGKQDAISDLATIRSGAAKGATAVQPPSLSAVATSGSYNDLTDKPTIPAAQIQSDWSQADSSAKDFIKNKPTIPAAQVNSDWNASSGVAAILNKPAVPAPAITAPVEDGTADVGSSNKYAREDHVHPTDTSRVAVSGDSMEGPLNFGDAFLDPTDGTICYGGSLNGTLIKLEEMSLWDPHSGTESAKRWTMEVTRDGPPGYEDIATLDDLEPKLDADQRNVVPYAESVDLTLDPVVSVYRLSPTGTAISIPSPVTTALPATDGYYQFEIELMVPSTATSLTAPSGWTWLTGYELPASGYAGKTVYVSCRMDLLGNAVTASCWRVA